MLYDDVELYLNDSSASSFDSDSDSGFSTPSQHDDDHPSCFSTPMTPMSPFMENDTEDHPLYPTEGEDVQELSFREETKSSKPVEDGNRALLLFVCFLPHSCEILRLYTYTSQLSDPFQFSVQFYLYHPFYFAAHYYYYFFKWE